MYRIHEVKLRISQDKSEIPSEILKKLAHQGVGLKIDTWRIVKESIDARKKADIKMVYSVDFTTNPERILSAIDNSKLEVTPDTAYQSVIPGFQKMKNPPVIVGFGPCGMFAALILSEMGYSPIVIERGKEILDREKDVADFWEKGILNPESNVQFGEGGAGTFSDGKLTTGTKDLRFGKVLEEFVAAGGGSELLYKQKPHMGTDVLRGVVTNIREKIIKNGGKIRFETKLTSLQITDGALTGITANQIETIQTEHLILAIGHSARDTLRYLNELGMHMQQKPFSIGVRIEHPQALINNAQYGSEDDGGLGAAIYKLSHHCQNGRGVYTFCMCPGGEVITASSQIGGVVTNGMSRQARDGKYANSGLLVDVRTADFPSEHPLAGIEFQEKYERFAFENGGSTYQPPKTTWREFVADTQNAAPVKNSLPAFATEAILEAVPIMSRKLRGFDSPDMIMTAVETRSSSPVRILRDEGQQSNIKGVYPAGEGAGYAGGIVSAAVDGIKIAEEIIKQFEPINLK